MEWAPNLALVFTSLASLLAIGMPLLVGRVEREAEVRRQAVEEMRDLLDLVVKVTVDRTGALVHNQTISKMQDEGQLSTEEALALIKEYPEYNESDEFRLEVLCTARGIDPHPFRFALSKYRVASHKITYLLSSSDPADVSKTDRNLDDVAIRRREVVKQAADLIRQFEQLDQQASSRWRAWWVKPGTSVSSDPGDAKEIK